MVEKISDIKNRVIEEIEKTLRDKGADRIDGEMVDIVKDLAAAEKDCWEAEYYRSVVEAMEGAAGYMPAGYQIPQNGRMGNQWQYGNPTMKSGGRRGYNGSYGYSDPMEELREKMQGASQEEREKMKAELRSMIG